MQLYSAYYQSPLGWLRLDATDKAMALIEFVPGMGSNSLNTPDVLRDCCRQLDEYFAGNRLDFELPVYYMGTAFQQIVWQALRSIPYGETRSYKDIGVLLNKPKASRAIGMANNQNRLPLLIPCHRVIGSDGSLVGYAGGLDKKAWLLNHEQKMR